VRVKFAFEGILPVSQGLKSEEHPLSGKYTLSSEWKKHCITWKKTINVRNRGA
jgi:hypothetical protein